MTPSQKIKYAIIKLDYEWTEEQLPEITKDNIDDIYYDGDFYEAADEIRRSGVETGLPKREYSRHYETEEVAIKTPDGSWVGFTFGMEEENMAIQKKLNGLNMLMMLIVKKKFKQ